MADNKKMRKFEGTCYIPGEQLAMMAKYYRGANLNLNLTLVEDEGIMKESLESSCWCSKLDDVERMKLRHMKGDAWAISHEHHSGGDQANTMGRGPMNCCFGAGKSPKEMKGELEAGVDKGTDTMSLYNHPPRRDYHDPRFDAWRGPQPMQDHYDGDRNFRRKDSQRRGFLPPYNIDENRPNHNIHAYYAAKSQNNDYYNTHQYRRSIDHEMEDDIASRYTAEESDNDIKCVVCKKDVCAVCKNPIRGWPCHCKCVMPNAGLCNECDMQCDKESGKEDVISKGQQQQQPQSETNWSNLMLLLMGSQMFNRAQNTGPSCKCDVK
uniref:Phenylalanine--tRNA ligase alpha subunit n=1 Tax=Lygus hesperus TaxID=30085 RepID=A0A0A9W5A6_LYGHE